MNTIPPPGKKKRTKGGRYSHEITKEEIEQYYHLPCEEASKQLGIGLTILKRICRRLGIEKWPYRQLKRAGKLGDAAAASAAATSGGGTLATPFQAASGASGGSVPNCVPSHSGGASQQQQQQQAQQYAWPDGDGDGGSDDSGGSWRAGHRGVAPGGHVLPVMHRQGSEPLPPPSRRSLELGRPSPGEGAAGGPGAVGLQRATSATLKRIREEEADPLLSLLGSSSLEAQPSPNPFAAAAALPEPGWGDGGAPPAPGADALAASLNRLAMRTLSLKRQCSRDDTALDALDQALLQERLDARNPVPAARLPPSLGMSRACSMPTAGSAPRGAPPLPRPAGGPRGGGYDQQGWLAAEQLRLPPLPPGQARALGGGAASSPFGVPGVQAGGRGGGMDVIAEPLDGLELGSDPSLSALVMSLGGKRSASGSDLASDAGLLPDASAFLTLHHASSTGSAQREGAGADGIKRDTSAVFITPASGDGGAAGVTSVGPPAEGGIAAAGPQDSLAAMLSPFGGPSQDNEVDDLLADFLGPVPSNRAAELLAQPSPKLSPMAEAPAGALDPPASAFAAAAAQPAASGGAISHGTPASSAGGMPASAFGAAGAQEGGDVMQLAAQLVSDPDPVKQLLASRLLQMQQQQAAAQQAAAAAAQQQQQQQQALLAHHAAAQQMLAGGGGGPGRAGWPASPGGDAAPAPQLAELQAAAAHHAAVQLAYLQQRHEVRLMLAQRGAAPAGIAGDPERLAQLARLKQLKEQLAAAQARRAELARAAAGGAPPPQQQQPFVPSAFAADMQSAFAVDAPRLGPPPPLPQQARGHDSGVAALYSQWQAEDSLDLSSLPPPGGWVGGAGWAPAGAPAGRGGAVTAQRAASAPLLVPVQLPLDHDWAAML